jgi:hypothetical protein
VPTTWVDICLAVNGIAWQFETLDGPEIQRPSPPTSATTTVTLCNIQPVWCRDGANGDLRTAGGTS